MLFSLYCEIRWRKKNGKRKGIPIMRRLPAADLRKYRITERQVAKPAASLLAFKYDKERRNKHKNNNKNKQEREREREQSNGLDTRASMRLIPANDLTYVRL
jgi:hypothetical protein